MKHAFLTMASISLLSCSLAVDGQPRRHFYQPPAGYVPAEGFVPDAKTAIRIAVAVWSPIYGEKDIQAEKPFQAKLNRGIWTVTGSSPRGFRVGGVAEAEISKKDGRVLMVIHGK